MKHGKMQENQPGRASVPNCGMRLGDLRGQKSGAWHVNDQPLGSECGAVDQHSTFDLRTSESRTHLQKLQVERSGLSRASRACGTVFLERYSAVILFSGDRRVLRVSVRLWI